MALIPPFFIDAVVAIGYEGKDGKIFWSASGFFYVHPVKDNTGKAYLVTNKHVLKDKELIYIRVNPKTGKRPKGYKMGLVDNAGNKLWWGHHRKNVDVAIIPVMFNVLVEEGMQVNFFNGEQHCLTSKDMKRERTSEGDGVFILGYPISIVGDKSNSVIVRSGTIARLRDTLESPTTPFMVDGVVFPGNSGGPVVNKPEIVSITGTKALKSANLIGIVAAYVPYNDVAISRQTGRPRIIFEENSGLSEVYSVDCIKTAINGFERQQKKMIKHAKLEKSQKAIEKVTATI